MTTAIVPSPYQRTVPSSHDAFTRWVSRIMYGMCIAFTVLILSLLVLVTLYLIVNGLKWLSPAFFLKSPILSQDQPGWPGGMLNGIVGTTILIIMASVLGIPIGMLGGIFLSEYDSGSKLVSAVRFVADVLTGVPSIVVGILGYELLVAPVHRNNAWAGALALAFIMVPLVARTTEEMLRLIPNSYREASIALGATKARTILKVVLPSAVGSIVTGVMLAIARIAGETAPLLFTTLGNNSLTFNLNDNFPALTKQVYDQFEKPSIEEQGQAWAGILVLISMIFVLNVAIRFVTRARK